LSADEAAAAMTLERAHRLLATNHEQQQQQQENLSALQQRLENAVNLSGISVVCMSPHFLNPTQNHSHNTEAAMARTLPPTPQPPVPLFQPHQYAYDHPVDLVFLLKSQLAAKFTV